MVDTQQSTTSVLPSVERIQQELARATSINDFFGKEGIFARLFADTLEQMLEAELTAHLGYPRHAPEGRNSGNSRNGKRTRQLRTSTGDPTIQVPRDRNSTFQSPLLDAYQTSTNEIDGLNGFKDAIQAVFPRTQIQRCILHQVRQSLTDVSWKDRKAFVADLRTISQAPTREAAETRLLELSERWSASYPMAVRSWETHWEDLATMFEYSAEIRRLIYTTNSIEGYNRQLRKVTKTKGAFPTGEAARKLLFLVNRDITRKWTAPVANWARIRNQLAIRFTGRFPM